eukprot:1826477-Pleurochrysis_carterae.AAC.2
MRQAAQSRTLGLQRNAKPCGRHQLNDAFQMLIRWVPRLPTVGTYAAGAGPTSGRIGGTSPTGVYHMSGRSKYAAEKVLHTLATSATTKSADLIAVWTAGDCNALTQASHEKVTATSMLIKGSFSAASFCASHKKSSHPRSRGGLTSPVKRAIASVPCTAWPTSCAGTCSSL